MAIEFKSRLGNMGMQPARGATRSASSGFGGQMAAFGKQMGGGAQGMWDKHKQKQALQADQYSLQSQFSPDQPTNLLPAQEDYIDSRQYQEFQDGTTSALAEKHGISRPDLNRQGVSEYHASQGVNIPQSNALSQAMLKIQEVNKRKKDKLKNTLNTIKEFALEEGLKKIPFSNIAQKILFPKHSNAHDAIDSFLEMGGTAMDTAMKKMFGDKTVKARFQPLVPISSYHQELPSESTNVPQYQEGTTGLDPWAELNSLTQQGQKPLGQQSSSLSGQIAQQGISQAQSAQQPQAMMSRQPESLVQGRDYSKMTPWDSDKVERVKQFDLTYEDFGPDMNEADFNYMMTGKYKDGKTDDESYRGDWRDKQIIKDFRNRHKMNALQQAMMRMFGARRYAMPETHFNPIYQEGSTDVGNDRKNIDSIISRFEQEYPNMEEYSPEDIGAITGYREPEPGLRNLLARVLPGGESGYRQGPILKETTSGYGDPYSFQWQTEGHPSYHPKYADGGYLEEGGQYQDGVTDYGYGYDDVSVERDSGKQRMMDKWAKHWGKTEGWETEDEFAQEHKERREFPELYEDPSEYAQFENRLQRPSYGNVSFEEMQRSKGIRSESEQSEMDWGDWMKYKYEHNPFSYIFENRQPRQHPTIRKHGGTIQGPSHEQGGVNIEVEGGEVIIPAYASANVKAKAAALVKQARAEEYGNA